MLRDTNIVPKASNSCLSTYGAASPSPSAVLTKDRSACWHKAAECLCSACVLFVCCPISIVWCIIKLPCKIGRCLALHAKNGTCCGSHKRINYASYSSFSDMDFDDGLAKGHDDDSCKARVTPSIKSWAQRWC